MTATYTAGPSRSDLVSDLRVKYIPSEASLTVDIQRISQDSKRDWLKDHAETVCKELGVETGQLILEDYNAPSFVISARVESVLKKAIPNLVKEALPEMKPYSQYPSSRDRLRRSRLYIPGNQVKRMLNAGRYKPDGIILDLEDSVSPAEKEDTRYLIRNALRTLDFQDAERMMRINQGEMGLQDLEFVIPHNVHLILIPKVESADQIITVDEKIAEISKSCERTEPVFLMPIIESARGVLKALEIAEASKNNVALAIGLEDYTADIRTQRTDKDRESLFARSMIVNAARAAGLQPIDAVFTDFGDEKGLRESVREAKRLGFDGKGCIHPYQIKPVHEEFAPLESEVEKAKEIVLAFDKAETENLGVVSIGTKMVDPPVVKRALNTVRLAIAAGMLNEDWDQQ